MISCLLLSVEKFLQKIIFGNFYIAFVAVVMCITTQKLFSLPCDATFSCFIFFATLSSYSLHWYLTNNPNSIRKKWTMDNKRFLWILFLISVFGTLYFFSKILFLWKSIVLLAFFTFLYTAPKIPLRFFQSLKGIAFGKTFYLTLIWILVTVFLPLQNAKVTLDTTIFWFGCNRFCLILSISMFFDFRDRVEDFGIKNVVTYLDESQIKIFFSFVAFLFFCSLYPLLYIGISETLILALPMFLLIFTFKKNISTTNDYWFYIFLDGMMMISVFLIILDLS